jgi:hypothetical protein
MYLKTEILNQHEEGYNVLESLYIAGCEAFGNIHLKFLEREDIMWVILKPGCNAQQVEMTPFRDKMADVSGR